LSFLVKNQAVCNQKKIIEYFGYGLFYFDNLKNVKCYADKPRKKGQNRNPALFCDTFVTTIFFGYIASIVSTSGFNDINKLSDIKMLQNPLSLIRNQQVGGSNPPVGSNNYKGNSACLLEVPFLFCV